MSLEEMINFKNQGEKPGDIVMARVSDGLGLKTEMKGKIIKHKPKTRYEDEWSLWRVELLEDYPDYLWGPEKKTRGIAKFIVSVAIVERFGIIRKEMMSNGR